MSFDRIILFFVWFKSVIRTERFGPMFGSRVQIEEISRNEHALQNASNVVQLRLLLINICK
jgi:hypothetical protein